MNKIGKKNGNMYEGVRTWNPLAGRCLHECKYCSTNSFIYPVLQKKYAGELRLDENAFMKNLHKHFVWFVCAQNDLYAEQVPEEFIFRIYDHIAEFPLNTYWFQSKNPARMYRYITAPYIYGTTIESNRDYELSNTSSANLKSVWMRAIRDSGVSTFITIEPILDFDLHDFVKLLKDAKPSWINIGADSKRHNLPEPDKEKVLELISELEKFTEVRQKTNLRRLLK